MGLTGSERWTTATHEAGHVVVAFALGVSVFGASIRRGEELNGWVSIADTGTPEDQGMIRVAGRVALLLTDFPTRGCEQDEREARGYALDAARGSRDHARWLLADWRAASRELLADHRDELGAITIELLRRETSTRGELWSAFCSARTPRQNTTTRTEGIA
jgi:ATP-dependent Zn protease